MFEVKISASQVGAILGYNSFKSRDDVMGNMVLRAHGYNSGFVHNDATLHGATYERWARLWAQIRLGQLINDTETKTHPLAPWLVARFDGVVDIEGLPIEIKCPHGLFHKYAVTGVADFKPLIEQPNYYAQVQVAMMCYGVNSCYFYQYVKPDVDHLEKVELCEEWATGVEAHLKAFYDEFKVESRNPAKWLEAVVKQQTEDEPRNPYTLTSLGDPQ
jgi:putative phage-type endonuclease